MWKAHTLSECAGQVAAVLRCAVLRCAVLCCAVLQAITCAQPVGVIGCGGKNSISCDVGEAHA